MQKVAVFYLARIREGLQHFEKFADSYRLYPAGEPHDLYIICKGRVSPGTAVGVDHIFREIPHRKIEVSDEGYDIQAYIKCAQEVSNPEMCFFNTFTTLQSENWLKKMTTQYRKSGIGAVGASGSYESLSVSMELINKVVWLAGSGRACFSRQLVEQFKSALAFHHSPWVSRSPYVRIRRAVAEYVRGRLHVTDPLLHQEFIQYFSQWTQEGKNWHYLKDFPGFPNPHLRSTALLTSREKMLEWRDLGPTKVDAGRFESGSDGFSQRLREQGLEILVVGADGKGYPVDKWPESRTFRLGNQENLLASDNRIAEFAHFGHSERDMLARITWGERSTHPNPKLLDLGYDFNTQQSPSKNPNLQKPRARYQELKLSIVVPTRNRSDLLRDAIYTVTNQKYSSWELVIFDNASADGLKDVQAMPELMDSRIRLIRSDEFLPVTDSWNRAIDLATGDYIMLIGDDDGVIPGYFSKINGLIHEFDQPDFIYSSLFQFMHPGVFPSCREGFLSELKNGFFFARRGDAPFILNKKEADHAWQGSLDFKRNFTFNMQAFTFKREFLDSLRFESKVFHSPFPDYYLANLAMARAEKILISPVPLAVAGVSTASFGYTLFNGLEQEGAALLNGKLAGDPLFKDYEKRLLPGSQYQDNYIITMGHLAKNIPSSRSTSIGVTRYRRHQAYSLIREQHDRHWMKSSERARFLWSRLSLFEKLWASWIAFLCRRGWTVEISRRISETAFIPLQRRVATGEFARLPEVFEMLRSKALEPLEESLPAGPNPYDRKQQAPVSPSSPS